MKQNAKQGVGSESSDRISVSVRPLSITVGFVVSSVSSFRALNGTSVPWRALPVMESNWSSSPGSLNLGNHGAACGIPGTPGGAVRALCRKQAGLQLHIAQSCWGCFWGSNQGLTHAKHILDHLEWGPRPLKEFLTKGLISELRSENVVPIMGLCVLLGQRQEGLKGLPCEQGEPPPASAFLTGKWANEPFSAYLT